MGCVNMNIIMETGCVDVMYGLKMNDLHLHYSNMEDVTSHETFCHKNALLLY